MFNFFSGSSDFTDIIERGAQTSITEKQFFEREIAKWKRSPSRRAMITGERYYLGDHDILNRRRTIIGKDGLLQEVNNLPNSKIVDNQYAKMVDQKVNYLLGKPLTFNTDNAVYAKALRKIFGKRFQRTLKNLGEDALNGGIAWLYPYYDDAGELSFKKFAPYEILPFWKDAEHTVLDCALRLYEVQAYEGLEEKIIEKVEIYRNDGIGRYILVNGTLVHDMENPSGTYMTTVDKNGIETGLNWAKIPLIAFKYNNKETPLIKRVKSLQDGINAILSDFQNNMQEDARNTILVIKNYDGTNLAEFRHNLATYGAVKVKTADGADGGVETLSVSVNAENYKAILDLFKKAVVENARGFDAKDDRLNGSPNEMNIRSMYSDIDLDANGMETEFQTAFEELLWFADVYLANSGTGNFEDEEIEIIFNRNVLINESETIDNCAKSAGIISEETIIAQHPWTTDVKKELERLNKEKEPADEYKGAFGAVNNSDGGDGNET
ncbi:MAG: phage portal protein [Bacillota bacterium]|nr:phage portal protein [Bacillota bacterium]